MAEHFSKTYTSPEDLVKLLMSRGLQVSNEAKAAAYIRNIGYFRLSAYFYPFLKKPKNLHQYKKRSSFNKVLKLYRFDRKLRLIMFNEIEKIEVAIRSTMVNIVCAETNDPFWMTNARYFAGSSEYRETIKLIKKEYDRSREDFIKHFKQKYSEPYPPAWELVEILPLGVITRIYGNIRDFRIQKMIAKRFYLNIPVFESWMTILTLTRNSCCHHARVWNREYTIKALRMKKNLILVFALLLVFTAGCSASAPAADTEKSSQTFRQISQEEAKEMMTNALRSSEHRQNRHRAAL